MGKIADGFEQHDSQILEFSNSPIYAFALVCQCVGFGPSPAVPLLSAGVLSFCWGQLDEAQHGSVLLVGVLLQCQTLLNLDSFRITNPML